MARQLSLLLQLPAIICFVITVCDVGVTCDKTPTCAGRSSLLQDYGLFCKTQSSLANMRETQSCLVEATALAENKTCSGVSNCTEVNIRVEDKEYDSENHIWSFAACFKSSMQIKVCTDNFETNTTTSATTTQPENTTETSPPATTTGILTSDSSEDGMSLDGCYEGSVTFTENCESQSVTVTLTHEENGNEVNFTAEVVGCCLESNCKVKTSSQNLRCNYGDDDSTREVMCSGACFTAITEESGEAEVKHGCLNDFSDEELKEFDVDKCSLEYEAGMCLEADDSQACLRCCMKSLCNDWTSADDILNQVTTSDSGAVSLYFTTPFILGVLLAYNLL